MTPPNCLIFLQFFDDNYARIESFSFIICVITVVFISHFFECSRIFVSFVWMLSYSLFICVSTVVFFSYIWLQSYSFLICLNTVVFFFQTLDATGIFFSHLFECSRVLFYVVRIQSFLLFSFVRIQSCSFHMCEKYLMALTQMSKEYDYIQTDEKKIRLYSNKWEMHTTVLTQIRKENDCIRA